MKKLNTYFEIIELNKGKRVLVYGIGLVANDVLSNDAMKNLNIIGISDIKYKNRKNKTFRDFPAFSPDDIENIEYDTLLVLLEEPKYIEGIINAAESSGHGVFHFKGERFPFEKYNKIILVNENGEEKEVCENDLPIGFSLRYDNKCKNNVIKITLPQNRSNVNIHFVMASDSYFELDTTKYHIDRLDVIFSEASNMRTIINKDAKIYGTSIVSNAIDSEIEIGSDCLMAANVDIRGSDGHAIYDLNTGKLINKQKHKLTIGNHVWLGCDTKIMKNAVIPDGSIVGRSSIVTQVFKEPNIVIAGNPAKIVKRNVLWKHEPITSELPDMIDV